MSSYLAGSSACRHPLNHRPSSASTPCPAMSAGCAGDPSEARRREPREARRCRLSPPIHGGRSPDDTGGGPPGRDHPRCDRRSGPRPSSPSSCLSHSPPPSSSVSSTALAAGSRWAGGGELQPPLSGAPRRPSPWTRQATSSRHDWPTLDTKARACHALFRRRPPSS